MRVCPGELVSPERPMHPGMMMGKPLAFLNVGTGIDLSINELAEQVAAAVGFTGSIHWDTANRMAHQRNNWM